MFMGATFLQKYHKNPLEGERINFSLFERKVTKEANNLAGCLPASMEAVYCKARWSLRERLRERRTVRLPKTRRFSDATRFFVKLPIVWKLFFWCAKGTVSPPRAYFIPSEFVKQFRSPLFYGILRKNPLGAK